MTDYLTETVPAQVLVEGLAQGRPIPLGRR